MLVVSCFCRVWKQTDNLRKCSICWIWPEVSSKYMIHVWFSKTRNHLATYDFTSCLTTSVVTTTILSTYLPTLRVKLSLRQYWKTLKYVARPTIWYKKVAWAWVMHPFQMFRMHMSIKCLFNIYLMFYLASNHFLSHIFSTLDL